MNENTTTNDIKCQMHIEYRGNYTIPATYIHIMGSTKYYVCEECANHLLSTSVGQIVGINDMTV